MAQSGSGVDADGSGGTGRRLDAAADSQPGRGLLQSSSGGWWSILPGQLPSLEAWPGSKLQQASNLPPVRAANGPADGTNVIVTASGPGDPYGQFAITLMTASVASAARLRTILDPVLQRLGLQGSVNVLPIGGDFVSNIGLQPSSPYFMMLARNILAPQQLEPFKSYLA
ncbi:uncharacterized protein HaLaN_28482, partial [Haematococcus lacustris]